MKRQNIKCSYNKEKMKEFLDIAKNKLSGQKSRIVLLNTPDLFTYRSLYLRNIWDTNVRNRIVELLIL